MSADKRKQTPTLNEVTRLWNVYPVAMDEVRHARVLRLFIAQMWILKEVSNRLSAIGVGGIWKKETHPNYRYSICSLDVFAMLDSWQVTAADTECSAKLLNCTTFIRLQWTTDNASARLVSVCHGNGTDQRRWSPTSTARRLHQQTRANGKIYLYCGWCHLLHPIISH